MNVVICANAATLAGRKRTCRDRPWWPGPPCSRPRRSLGAAHEPTACQQKGIGIRRISCRVNFSDTCPNRRRPTKACSGGCSKFVNKSLTNFKTCSNFNDINFVTQRYTPEFWSGQTCNTSPTVNLPPLRQEPTSPMIATKRSPKGQPCPRPSNRSSS